MNTNTSSTPAEQWESTEGVGRGDFSSRPASVHRCFHAYKSQSDILQTALFASIPELDELLEDLHILIDRAACRGIILSSQM